MSDRDLPEELALPLLSGEPWWYWLGGRPALDLVNTLRERWRRRVETLVTPQDLRAWLIHAGVLTADAGPLPSAALAEARELREAIDAGVVAALAGRRPVGRATATIDRWLAEASTRPRLVIGDDGRHRFDPAGPVAPPRDRGRRAIAAVALDAAAMLGTPAEAARIRICASDTCSARFYDRSPAGERRWCSMALCGNAAKARRHRARRRKVTP